MKIAIHNPGGKNSTELFIEKALKTNGVETFLFPYPSFFWITSLKKFDPDWIFFFSTEAGFNLFKRKSIQKIHKNLLKAKVGFWTFDRMKYHNRELWFFPLALEMNVVFMKETNLIEKLRNEGCNVFYLDQATTSETGFGCEKDEFYDCDLAFVGNVLHSEFGKERVNFLNFIASKFKLKIWTQYPKLWPDRFHSLIKGNLEYSDWSRLAASAKIVLGYDIPNIPGYWSNRIYRGLGSGCFFLTHYIQGMEKNFTCGKHVEWFTSNEEAFEKIGFYLKNPEKREQIRKAGYDHVHENHTYIQRTKELLKIIGY